ncbi:hypothetical protein AAFF_G00112960 [Aldrovandia affinis]|uniref:Uncharacterized protein n=1 Tax=Aldrovandia affinis TaxID=143900 RepID=A0AAD7RT95_9TELE|nr:hypothetical protein AAFF_G00112960 [Aldrovandia affinis]
MMPPSQPTDWLESCIYKWKAKFTLSSGKGLPRRERVRLLSDDAAHNRSRLNAVPSYVASAVPEPRNNLPSSPADTFCASPSQ